MLLAPHLLDKDDIVPQSFFTDGVLEQTSENIGQNLYAFADSSKKNIVFYCSMSDCLSIKILECFGSVWCDLKVVLP